MKKFVLRILLILVVSLLIVEAVNFVYCFFYKADRLTAYDNPEFRDMPETLTYINVGSSHGGQSFRYAPLGEEIYSEAFNFGMGGQSYVYDYKLLTDYEELINDQGGVLLIPISIFSLYVDEKKASDYASKILRYYPILDYRLIDGGNFTDYILYKYVYPHLPVLRMADKQINTIFYHPNPNIEFEDGRMEYDREGFPVVVQANYDALLQIIALGKVHHMRVVLITTPVQEEYYQSYGSQYLERFHADVEALVQETQVEYWNYENLYPEQEELFYDSNHLNEDGAAAFTQLVFDRLFAES